MELCSCHEPSPRPSRAQRYITSAATSTSAKLAHPHHRRDILTSFSARETERSFTCRPTMQAQSRFSVAGGSGGWMTADEHEALVRELTRGHELTAEAMRALQGQGQQAEDDAAAAILQKVSRAFAVCLSIMSSPAHAQAAAARRPRDENRREIVTHTPYSDRYLWRKYGQKRITNTSFPRCYFRCSCHREHGCPATKQVQQRSHGDPPQYVVVYVNEHTCGTAAWEPEAVVTAAPPPAVAAAATNPRLCLARPQEEQERQALVSSLAIVLGAHSPVGSSTGAQQHGTSASVVLDPSGGDVDAELDVMDYDVTGGLYFDGLPEDGVLPF